MIKVSFVSLSSDFLSSYFDVGVMSRCRRDNLVEFNFVNLRDFAVDRHGTIDGKPYGGGDGMVMMVEPLANAVESLKQENPSLKSIVLSPSPRAELWSQKRAEKIVGERLQDIHLIFICPRFGGVDQRFIDLYVEEEFSMGPFVMSAGELASLAACDSLLRFIPGVLGNQESLNHDSFSGLISGNREEDLYTKPSEFNGVKVPEILLSGNHEKIAQWRERNRKK